VVDSDFLAYLLVSQEIKERLLGIGDEGGSTRQALTKAQLQSFQIPIPPLEEQHQIVAVLDEAFEGLARARAHAEANLRDARGLFDSFLSNAFRMAEWPVSFLDEISENLDRVRVPITKGDRVAGAIPYYGASGVVDHVEGFLFDEDLLLVSEDGANLLARSYPIAFSISGKSWVNNHAHVLRFPDFETQEFVRLYLNSISLKPYVSGMAQPKLNQAQLNRIPIPFPSAAKRAELVAKAQMISAETVDLEQRYRATIADIDALRQSLLQKAFTGELT
jgi:type I restriction enzyme S subunit